MSTGVIDGGGITVGVGKGGFVICVFGAGVDVGDESAGTHSPSALHIPAVPSCKFKKSYITYDPICETSTV